MTDTDVVTVNLKLSRETRNSFKKTAKGHGHKTMQLVLSAFTDAYIENPDQFYIKTKLGVKSNGSSVQKEPADKS